MNNVQLPPGFQPGTASSAGIPYGAGRPIRPDSETAFYNAKAEIVRERHGKRGVMGAPTIFRDAEELRHACLEYCAWIDANPLLEQKVQFSSKQAMWAKTDQHKKRPYTQTGLCLYLAITPMTWGTWRKGGQFAEVVAEIDRVIVSQKFEGATSGFFNAMIIARDLGLADKQEVSGPGGGPVEKITSEMTPEQAMEAYQKTREK